MRFMVHLLQKECPDVCAGFFDDPATNRAFAGMATATGPLRIDFRSVQAPRSAVPKSRRRMSAWAGVADRSRFRRTYPSLTHHNQEHNRKWNIYCRNYHF
jgi:hypothetical protein